MKMLRLSCLIVATILVASLLLFPQKASASQTLSIVIDSVDVNDGYYRYHGLKIDGSLPTSFWTEEPSTIIGTSSGSFHYETTVTVSDGDHYIVYGVSAFMGVWHAKIYVNGNLVGEGDTDVYNHLVGWTTATESTTTPNLPNMFPWIDDFSDMDPYVGGYCYTSENTTSTCVRATVSFPDTPPWGKSIQEIIPAGNYIAGGIFVHGADKTIEGNDYGFVATLSLDHDGIIQYNMAFYVHHEPQLWPPSGWWYAIPWSKALVLNVDPSEPVTLTMQWDPDPSRVVKWFYTIDGIMYSGGQYDASSYSSTIHRAFWVGAGSGGVPAGSYDYYFYQFGVYSETVIPNSGWVVRLEHPQYGTSGNRWMYVQVARYLDGTYAYNDHWYRWGGVGYPYANARYHGMGLEDGFEVEFYGMDELPPEPPEPPEPPPYPEALGWVIPDTVLWNSPAEEPEAPSTPSGYSTVYKGFSYSYSTITLDPNDDNVKYRFLWGDGETGETGYYLSGVQATASHIWYSTGYYLMYVLAIDSTGREGWYCSPGFHVHVIEYTGGGGGGCVAKGTLITMADRSVKAVEKIKVGDKVLGFDPTTYSYTSQNVLATTSTRVELIENINNGALRLTPTDQPIYIRNSTYEGWIQDPASIQIGWKIYDAETGSWVAVTSVTYEEGKIWVYDFTTDGLQTYLANSFLLLDKGHKK